MNAVRTLVLVGAGAGVASSVGVAGAALAADEGKLTKSAIGTGALVLGGLGTLAAGIRLGGSRNGLLDAISPGIGALGLTTAAGGVGISGTLTAGLAVRELVTRD